MHCRSCGPGDKPQDPAVGEATEARVSRAPEPVVLILVGPPGSGKSTFAEELKQRQPGLWQRINQVWVCSDSVQEYIPISRYDNSPLLPLGLYVTV
jgi:replication-associated recombination protein RarA